MDNIGAKLAAYLAGGEPVLPDRAAGSGIHMADLSVCGEGIEGVVHLAGNPVAHQDWPDLNAAAS